MNNCSEAVAMAALLEPMEREAAKQRQLSGLNHAKEPRSGKLPEREKGEAGERIAAAVGMCRHALKRPRKIDNPCYDGHSFRHVIDQLSGACKRTRNDWSATLWSSRCPPKSNPKNHIS